MTDNEVFTVYRFEGIMELKSYGYEKKRMGLKECLDRVFITSYDVNTKQFFNRGGFIFNGESYTMEKLREKIAEGMAIFPVYEKQEIKEVKRYIDLGLDPVFMKYNDFRRFRKVYGEL